MTPARLQQYAARLQLPRWLTLDPQPRSLLQELAAVIAQLDPRNGIAPGRLVGTPEWLAALAQETWPNVCRLARAQQREAPALDDHVAHWQAQAAKGHLILFGLRVFVEHDGTETAGGTAEAAIPQRGEGVG